MMSDPKFIIGDEVFVHNPSRYMPGCVAILGVIDRIEPMGSSWKYSMLAEVVNPHPKPNGLKRVSIHQIDLGHRVGTPISQLIGENGRVTERFVDIANSWGYP